MSTKLEFKQSDSQAYVYMFRPKHGKDFDGIPIYLVVACDENSAWSFAEKEMKQYKDEFYLFDVFLSNMGHALGIMWPT